MIFIDTGIVSIMLIIFKHLLSQPQNTKNAEDCIRKGDVSSYLGYPGFVFHNVTFLKSLSLFQHSLIFRALSHYCVHIMLLKYVTSVITELYFWKFHFIPKSNGGTLLHVFSSVVAEVT